MRTRRNTSSTVGPLANTADEMISPAWRNAELEEEAHSASVWTMLKQLPDTGRYLMSKAWTASRAATLVVLVAVRVQRNLVRDLAGAFSVLPGASHRDEATLRAVNGAEVAVHLVEQHATGLSSPAEWNNEGAAVDQLVRPGVRQVPGADRDDDRVVGSAGGPSECAVAVDDGDHVVVGAGEGATRVRGDIAVDVDGGDLAAGSDDFGDQRGGVAGAGADLEHVVARLQVGLVEHGRNDGRLGDTADRSAAGRSGLDRDGVVDVRGGDSYGGDEQMPRHHPQRTFDLRPANAASGDEPVDHRVAKFPGRAVPVVAVIEFLP
jgi:hypothetical protein